jgi:hypothetical protein
MTQLTLPKCPSCGADLQVAGDGVARCQYCQKDIIVSGSPAPTSGSVQNVATLARAAADAGNDEEASTLWTRVLEHDPKNSEAWLGKAKAVPMTIGGMLAGFAQAESYCQRAKESAPGRDDVERAAYVVLSSLLDVMVRAAQEHFDEFMEVDDASAEYLERMFFVLDAHERLAGPESNPVEYQAAIDLCDKLLADRLIAQAPSLKRELADRRRRYLEKGGPLLAQVRAEVGQVEKAEREPSAAAARRKMLALAGVVVVLLVLGTVGYGRWNSTQRPTAAMAVAGPAASPTTSSPSASSWPAGGSEARAAGFPQTLSIPGDSTCHWIAVHFVATNDRQTTAYSSPDPRLVDSTGRNFELWADESYDPYLPPGNANYRILSAEDVKPGLKKDYWAIFEVPPNTSGLRLRIHALQGKGIRDLPLQF